MICLCWAYLLGISSCRPMNCHVPEKQEKYQNFYPNVLTANVHSSLNPFRLNRLSHYILEESNFDLFRLWDSKRKMVELFANSGDPDQTSCSAASDLGLHCLSVTLLGVSNGLRGMDTLTREEAIKFIFAPFWKGVYCIRKEFFPYRVDPFSEEDWCNRTQKGS